jgi:hypothetical protein
VAASAPLVAAPPAAGLEALGALQPIKAKEIVSAAVAETSIFMRLRAPVAKRLGILNQINKGVN